jgi:hypothetical protein
MHAGANAAIAELIGEAGFRREIVKARYHILALRILAAQEEGILHLLNLPFCADSLPRAARTLHIAACRATRFIAACRAAGSSGIIAATAKPTTIDRL